MSRSLPRIMGRVVRALAVDLPKASDRELLSRFIASRDPDAFAALVRRHGAMVRCVCRRILRHDHDAEDAFQATFLVLVCKARTIKRKAVVGNWLYGVAYRTAVRARAIAAKRREREGNAAQSVEPVAAVQDSDVSEILTLLDKKLNALPDRYRVPIVLCDLQGKTRKEAADQLGWPEGTVAGRLARGRAILAKRLGKTIGALAVVLAAEASASVPIPLVEATLRAASLYQMGSAATAVSGPIIALTQGVMNAMFLTRLKIAAIVVLSVAVGGMGTGGLLFGTQETVPTVQPNPAIPGPSLPEPFRVPGPPTHEQLREKYLKLQSDFARHLSADELAKRTAELEKIVADAVQREQKLNREKQAMAELEKAKAMLMKIAKEHNGTEAASRADDALRVLNAGRGGALPLPPPVPVPSGLSLPSSSAFPREKVP